ncbi:alpha/beta hydrolase [Mucilaginibacter sp. CAU 1740]|uniref:alpha/beta fold hydrolase n=1 Tax=Mucilaginibacter sp. CAU 1740 TaxID=3140365 RepID=UPI00325B8FE5
MKTAVRYLEAEGTVIAYREENPDREKTVFFLHGNSGSRQTWDGQMASPLLSDFRMVAFDLPAHGNSGGPDTDAFGYSLARLARIMSSAINMLGGDEPYFLAGLSLGSNIACESLALVKARGLVMISPCIIGADYPVNVLFRPGADLRAVFADDADERLIHQTLLSCVHTGTPELLADLLADYHKVKGNFRSRLYESVQKQQYGDEIKMLQESGIRPLVLFGEDDPISNIGYLDPLEHKMWNGKIYKLKQASHFLHLDQPSLVTKLLHDYFGQYK